MGTAQSSTAKSANTLSKKSKAASSGSGRKTNRASLIAPELQASDVSFQHHDITVGMEDSAHLEDDHPVMIVEESLSMSDSDESEEEEDDSEWEERLRILEDAKQLKQMAQFFLHPEAPVVSNTSSRCFFDRPSAPMIDQERQAILDDMKALKELAVAYRHPERPVITTDAMACGRCYFDRASAPVVDEERDAILADIQALKEAARHYLHPEDPVVTTDPLACARNYFDRASAVPQESAQEVAERAAVLADAHALKRLAVDYMHPEKPVVTTDPTACGRNYYSRASAPEYDEDPKIRKQILEDAAAFKQLAVDYMHPELPVVIVASATGRNYFDRPSAPEYESLEDAQARAQVMDDMRAFKQLVQNYLHPERAIQTYPMAFGRNYFDRPSAPTHESVEEAEERARVLEECRALKQLAVDYHHPELPVKTTDPFARGRNYFTRPSAPEVDTAERDAVLADAMALKQLAVQYKHPELPIQTTDPFACGRNFFTRASAADQESMEQVKEREQVLQDAKDLKELAVHYTHPELPVVIYATATGRNYFTRASAPEQEALDEAQERAQILADAQALKTLAVDYRHPELGVTTTDSFACGRNYFDRPSAPLHERSIHTFPAHEESVTDHHELDHFGMDEDFGLFADIREELEQAPDIKDNSKVYAGSDVGSNLSRSPSSVMLFVEE